MQIYMVLLGNKEQSENDSLEKDMVINVPTG